MAKQREIFMAGAVARNFPKAKAGEIFDQMEKFAGYGFNKSHSAAYSLLAYHTAWLKTHYPVEFMAALLTSETSKPENVVKYISECREMNIPVVPPNVQVSDANFTPIITPAGKAIGFGLAAIKNVGHNAIESIITARTAFQAAGKPGFASLWEFCEKVDLRLLNKRVLESLIKAGAMDAFGGRAQLCAALDKAMERAQKSQTRRSRRPARTLRHLRLRRPSRRHQKRRRPPQRSRVGRAHPPAKRKRSPRLLRLRPPDGQVPRETSQHEGRRHRHSMRDEARAAELPPPWRRAAERDLHRRRHHRPQSCKIQALWRTLRPGLPRRHCRQDRAHRLLRQSYEKLADKLKIDVPVLVRGVLRGEEDSAPKLALSNIQALEDVKIKLPDSLRIKVPLHNPDTALLEKLHAVFLGAPGKGKVLLDLEEPGEFCAVLEPHNITVAADRLFIDHIEELVGRGGVRVLD